MLRLLRLVDASQDQCFTSMGDVNFNPASFASRLRRTSGSGVGSTFLIGALGHRSPGLGVSILVLAHSNCATGME